jgi:hypothetical protein
MASGKPIIGPSRIFLLELLIGENPKFRVLGLVD